MLLSLLQNWRLILIKTDVIKDLSYARWQTVALPMALQLFPNNYALKPLNTYRTCVESKEGMLVTKYFHRITEIDTPEQYPLPRCWVLTNPPEVCVLLLWVFGVWAADDAVTQSTQWVVG